MTPELYAALASLGLAALTALGYFVRYIGLQIQMKVEENTRITEQVERQTNGELAKARNQAQKAMAAFYRVRKLQQEQQWLIEQLQRSEEGRKLIDRVMQARRSVVYDGDYDDLMTRLLRESRQEGDPHA